MLLLLTGAVDMVAAVVDMAVAVADSTAVAAVGSTAADCVPAGAVVDTSAVDTLWPHTSRLDTSRLDSSRLDTSWLDMDPVRTLRMDIEVMCVSRVDTTAISGTAVGGITALVRVGYGRTITASTCGPAIERSSNFQTFSLNRHFFPAGATSQAPAGYVVDIYPSNRANP